MVWKKLVPIAVICALSLVAGSAAQGSKATKHHHKHHHARLPADFFGMNPNSGTPTPAQYARMRRGGIRSFRTPVVWRAINYLPGVYNWSSVDHVMKLAPKAGLDVLPFIYWTPWWVNHGDGLAMPVGSAAQEFAWATFLAALVARYGPHGTFWKLNPDVPYSPVRFWQIWNEMNLDSFTKPISPVGYARMLKVSRQTLNKVDPGAKIVIGGLFGEPYQPKRNGDVNDIAYMRRLYKVKGVKSAFDVYCPAPLRGRREGDEEGDRQHPGADEALGRREDAALDRRVRLGLRSRTVATFREGTSGPEEAAAACLHDDEEEPGPVENRPHLLVLVGRQPGRLRDLRWVRPLHNRRQAEARLVRLRQADGRKAVAHVFKTIVLALDGSDTSKRAVPVAVELAKRDGAKLVLAHVDERIVAKGGGDIHFDEQEIQADVRKLAEELAGDGLETGVEMADVMAGGAGRVIAEIAERVSADLIVTGTRGHSPVGGVLLGSVTQRLLHLAKQPVLVVP